MNPNQPAENLQFLKLGGSLITDKTRPRTPRPETIARLAREITLSREKNPDLKLVLGHGAGSFAHVPAKKYGTRQGVYSDSAWQGFAEVWEEAVSLNRLIMAAFRDAGLPAIALPPSAGVIANDGQVISWDLGVLQAALMTPLLPVVYGDVIFDAMRGGTILSTEDLFIHLAHELHPRRILLAGLEPGVWADYPACTRLLPEITPEAVQSADISLGDSPGTDVTGGMASKVRQMVELVMEIPDLEVLIFSGEEPGAVVRALSGEIVGTVVRQKPASHIRPS
jgi:isopentenyl phosphate kinase